MMCDALAAQEPWWTPGDGHGYHAFSFGFLVGEVVRRVGGESLGTFFRKNVAEPLGADFHIGLSAEHDARTASMINSPAADIPRSAPPPGPAINGWNRLCVGLRVEAGT